LHAARSPSTVLAVLAGNNGVSHNHNDIGTFMFYRKGRLMLTDPGAPKYTAKTFSPKRYDILFCRSRGHSVPIINGREQPQGKQYHGILTVEDTSEPGPKHAHIDMTRAYDVPTLKNLRRTFTLDVDGTLLLADRFRFSRKPTILQEAFITFETATIGRNGATVRIGPRSRNVTLTAPNTPGRFRVEKLDAESKEGKEDRIVTRITFEPEHLAARMDLVFEIR